MLKWEENRNERPQEKKKHIDGALQSAEKVHV